MLFKLMSHLIVTFSVFSSSTASASCESKDVSCDSSPVVSTEFNFPEPKNLGKRLRPWTTNYYVHQVMGWITGPYNLLSKHGVPLGPKLSELDWCQSAFEGTVRVINDQGVGTTYNYDGYGTVDQVPCKGGYGSYPATRKVRFRVSQFEFGEGVSNYILVPYRSIAVANKEIPYGSVVYIPEARGKAFTLPNGEERIHDGYFFAADTGAAMRKHADKPGWEYHIDIFTGIDEKTPIPIISNKPEIRWDMYVIQESGIKSALKSLHEKKEFDESRDVSDQD